MSDYLGIHKKPKLVSDLKPQARTITINVDELGLVDSNDFSNIKNNIVDYLNDGLIAKEANDIELWIEVLGNEAPILNQFSVSEETRLDHCNVDSSMFNFTISLYHNGAGEFPDVGDIVYSDANGTNVYTSPEGFVFIEGFGALSTNAQGQVQVLPSCE